MTKFMKSEHNISLRVSSYLTFFLPESVVRYKCSDHVIVSVIFQSVLCLRYTFLLKNEKMVLIVFILLRVIAIDIGTFFPS